MTKTVDSFRFVSRGTGRMAKSWIAKAEPQEIPWTPLSKPLSESTVAMISSGGIRLKDDQPFDQEGERQKPWWGDPSYRVIPKTAQAADVKVDHLHINPDFAEQDLNCLLPLGPLQEMAKKGEIGAVAASHYTYMGYTTQPEQLLQKSVPAIIRNLRDEFVDVVVLVPA
jgi:D-proline reductase (dithiol) PrdB